MSDFEFLDQLCVGTVSRRAFMEKVAAAGAGVSLLASAAFGQAPQKPPQPDNENPKYSPENIGGGGRLERNFYREWIRKSKVPMVEGYSIYDARDQEALPWPEIGGKGLYLNFSGNVHMDGGIVEIPLWDERNNRLFWADIPGGKSLVPRRHLYEQLLYVLKGRGHTRLGETKNAPKVDWSEGSLFTVPLNVVHRHFNDDSSHPARILAVTTFPFMLQVFGSRAFIEESKAEFPERFN